MPQNSTKILKVFANPQLSRKYEIHFNCPEFTCLCPKTGQPDFAAIDIFYVPDKLCIELKSLKLYIWSYRDKGAYHEAVINEILNDFVKACKPRYVKISGDFNVRGGIHTIVTAEHGENKKES